MTITNDHEYNDLVFMVIAITITKDKVICDIGCDRDKGDVCSHDIA